MVGKSVDVQRIIEINFNEVQVGITRLQDEHSAAFRWGMATFVSTNGGALIAIMSTDKLTHFGKGTSGLFFGAGMSFGMLLGYVTILLIQSLIKKCLDLRNFWFDASLVGMFDRDVLNEKSKALNDAMPFWKRLSHGFAGLSFGCLMLSIAQIVVNLK